MILPKTKVNNHELTLFTRKLATLVSTGIPLVQTLNIIIEGYPKTKSPMRSLLQQIKRELERGNALSFALKKHPQYFNKVYYGLIEIGELSGTIDNILLRLADNQEKSDSLKRKIKRALIYPLLIFFVAISITIFLLIYIVPTFQDMFQNFHLELPWPTKILLKLSIIMKTQGYKICMGLILSIFFAHRLYRSNKNLQHFIQCRSLQLPLLGPLIIKSQVAAITRMLATTEAAGVPLTSALETLAAITTHVIFARAIHHIRVLLTRGERLETALLSTAVFPTVVNQMIGIGEESGTLAIILDKLSCILDEELETALGQLTTLIEPIMMLFLGFIVGGLVIALYLPIFNMGSLF